MAIRFRKRVRVLPGVTLNLSGSGVSTTLGPRGASVNIGKKGVYLNTGIPGTGLYSRQRIDKPQPKVAKLKALEAVPEFVTPNQPKKRSSYWLGSSLSAIGAAIVWWTSDFGAALVTYFALLILWTALYLVARLMRSATRIARRNP